ncbi:MAG: vWA domain-containing protein [Pirellulales bacterium]
MNGDPAAILPEAEPADVAGEEADVQVDSRVRFWWRDLWRGCGASLMSAMINSVALVGLAYVAVEEPLRQAAQIVIAEVAPERPPDDLLKTELDDLLTPSLEVATATSYQLPTVSIAEGAPGTAGGGANGGSIAAPVLDKGVMEQASDIGISVAGLMEEAPPSKQLMEQLPEGAVGDPRSIVDNYQEAMDRITQEILWMLSKGDALVVWCFDQSESMKDDQKEIRDRIERVYAELGLAGGSKDRGLLTAVTSYGEGFRIHTSKPTADFAAIRKAIDEVPVDPSGKELMTLAVGRSIAQLRELAQRENRLMALVLVTDESGDREANERFLEQAIAEAKAARCRVYVLGREAVFGYPYAHMRWQHPQTKRVHWLPIDRGPEAAFVEQLQIDGFRRRHDAHPSGFGPYEQTRLARETGGIFFLLPSVETNLVRGEKQRYELEQMRPYVPDMRSRMEVILDRDDSPMRQIIWKVINDLNPYHPQASKSIEMRVSFSPQFQDFVKQAVESQVQARAYLPYLARAQEALEKIRELREREPSPRWQANYDLIYAQLIAYQARIFEYGAYLEWFTKNPPVVPLTKAPNLTLTHWEIRTRKELLREEVSGPYIQEADELFEAILHDHPGTPWAARAKDERARGYGVELIPVYEPPYPKPSGPVIPIPKY